MKNTLFESEVTKYYSRPYEEFSNIREKPSPLQWDKNHPYFKEKSEVFDDKETYEKNFDNPLFSLNKIKNLLVVQEEGDKISLRVYRIVIIREVGKLWYKTHKNFHFITVNKKTGDVYVGSILNYHLKRGFIKTIRRNYFVSLPISCIRNQLPIFNSVNENIFSQGIKVFLDALYPNSENLISAADDILFKYYLEKKGYKFPNNFKLFKFELPNKAYKKILLKNDKRMVDSFMIAQDLKGKVLKKCIHKCTKNFTVNNYRLIKELFGENFMNQHPEFIVKILDTEYLFSTNISLLKNFMSKEKLKNLYEFIMNYVIDGEINIWTFNDHIDTFIRLRNYNLNHIVWGTYNNLHSFYVEHNNWTNELSLIRTGTYERKYPTEFIQKIETEIDGYFPVVLKSSDEYNLESCVQQNCVRSYVGRPASLIVSLRKNEKNSTERATIEYKIQKKHDKILVSNVQKSTKFNAPLDSTWDDVILKLNEIVTQAHLDKNLKTVSIEKRIYNGTILNSDSMFNEHGNLIWEQSKDIIW